MFTGSGDYDTVDYSRSHRAVNAAIDGTNNSGEAGERDFLNPDIEAICRAAPGNDTLAGQAGAAPISLYGNSGNDHLISRPLRISFLDGGSGNDTLDRMRGDYLVGGASNDVLDRNSGDDQLYSRSSGNDTR